MTAILHPESRAAQALPGAESRAAQALPGAVRLTQSDTMARALPYLGLGCIVLAFVWTFRLPGTQLDDAYISYRYALNLAAGNGLVFNPGEYVEGYTNLLWTLLIAAGMKLGGDAPAIGHWLSVVFSAATLITTYAYTVQLTGGRHRLLALLTPAGLLASNAFVAWTTSGLETPLFTWLAVCAALAMARGRPIATALLCVAAFMTRPDGALLAACLLLPGTLRALRALRAPGANGTRLAWVAAAAGPAVVFAVGLAALTLFRVWYYGDIVPNTFYAKIGGIPLSRGLIYLRNALVDGPALLLPGAIVAAIWQPSFRPAATYIVLNAIYVVAIGGDVFALGRFILPSLPMLFGGALAGAILVMQRRFAAGACMTALLPACALWSLYGTWPAAWGPPIYDFRRHDAVAFPHSWKREAARIHWIFSPDEDALKHAQLARIRALVPPVRVLALVGIGKLGYWGADLHIIDMVGLTDRHIAHSGKIIAGTYVAPGHSRTDSAYVLSRRPDAIELPRRGTPFLPLPVVVDMWNNPDLERLYHYDASINCYVRN
jgi:arabinofuranosyltransferase